MEEGSGAPPQASALRAAHRLCPCCEAGFCPPRLIPQERPSWNSKDGAGAARSGSDSPQALTAWRGKTRLPGRLLQDLYPCSPRAPPRGQTGAVHFHCCPELLCCHPCLLPWGSTAPQLDVTGRNSVSFPWEKIGVPAQLCSGLGSCGAGKN